MALIDLWRNSPDQVSGKHVQQLVGFAGDGRLAEGNPASLEFRAFLGQIPSAFLGAQSLKVGNRTRPLEAAFVGVTV